MKLLFSKTTIFFGSLHSHIFGREISDSLDVRVKNLTALGLFFLTFAISLFVSVHWINLPLIEQHGFRQTQTALSSFWIERNKDWLTFFRYETPVVGSPWQIPFEFPLYQWAVALVHAILKTPLDATGRAISALAFYGCLIPAFVITEDWRKGRRLFFLLAAMLLASPLYLFWSRTFMIESTALLFSLSYYALFNRFFVRRNLWYVFLATLAGALAILVKVTTFAVFAAAAALLLMKLCFSEENRASKTFWRNNVIPAILSVGLPLTCFIFWLKYSDGVKAHHLIGKYFESSALSAWNYGSLVQRFSSDLWLKTIWNRALPESIGGLIAVGICGFGFFLATNRSRILMAILLLLYLLPFLVFTNLYIIHSYYQYGAAIFMVGVLGLSLFDLSQRLPASVFAFLGMAAIAGQYLVFSNVYLPSLANKKAGKAKLVLARRLLQRTQPGEAIVSFGSDWSSIIAYYSQRKTLSVPSFLKKQDLEQLLQQLNDHTGGLPVRAVVVNDKDMSGYSIQKEELTKRLDVLQTVGRVETLGSYHIYWIDPKSTIPSL